MKNKVDQRAILMTKPKLTFILSIYLLAFHIVLILDDHNKVDFTVDVMLTKTNNKS